LDLAPALPQLQRQQQQQQHVFNIFFANAPLKRGFCVTPQTTTTATTTTFTLLLSSANDRPGVKE
jgi:hypothetical protein